MLNRSAGLPDPSVFLLITVSVVVLSSSLLAQSGFDPRSMGMGGTGVAVANPATAPFFNPAVLSIEERERFSIDFPTLGARVYDPENFMDELNAFQNLDLVDELNDAVGDLSGDLTNAFRDDVVESINLLNSSLASLGGNPVQANIGIGLTLGDTGQKFGWTLYTAGTVQVGTIFNYSDGEFLEGFADAIDDVDFDNPANNTEAELQELANYVHG